MDGDDLITVTFDGEENGRMDVKNERTPRPDTTSAKATGWSL